MPWQSDIAEVIDYLEETQFPFASLADDLHEIAEKTRLIEGHLNEPVRDWLLARIQRTLEKHQRSVGVFSVLQALLIQRARNNELA